MLVVALASLGGVISTLPWPCVTAPQQLGGGGGGLGCQALAICWMKLKTLSSLDFPRIRVGLSSCSWLHPNLLIPGQGCYSESRACSAVSLVPLSHTVALRCSSLCVGGCSQQVVKLLLFWIGSSAPC